MFFACYRIILENIRGLFDKTPPPELETVIIQSTSLSTTKKIVQLPFDDTRPVIITEQPSSMYEEKYFVQDWRTRSEHLEDDNPLAELFPPGECLDEKSTNDDDCFDDSCLCQTCKCMCISIHLMCFIIMCVYAIGGAANGARLPPPAFLRDDDSKKPRNSIPADLFD